MIEARNLTRRYGDFTAVQGVSFTVNEGEIVGILGPNGAGKTTILRMITGFLPPTGGHLTVGGKDLFTEPVAVRRDIGYLPENVALYTEMRVSEYLWYRAMLEGMSRAEARTRIPEVGRSCILDEVENQERNDDLQPQRPVHRGVTIDRVGQPLSGEPTVYRREDPGAREPCEQQAEEVPIEHEVNQVRPELGPQLLLLGPPWKEAFEHEHEARQGGQADWVQIGCHGRSEYHKACGDRAIGTRLVPWRSYWSRGRTAM